MGYRARRSALAYLMLLPTLVLIGVFVFYPIYSAFDISLYKWDMLSPIKPFVGFQNYTHIFSDPEFQQALKNTALYVVVYVPTLMLAGLLTASLLNTKLKFLSAFRTALFIPYITALSATAILWQWIFNDQYGLLNYFLKRIGISGPDWLNDPHWTLFNVVVYSVWQNLGYVTVIFLAGLQGISKDYYEAADVDGASSWHKFRHITISLLSPTTYFVLIVSTIDAFKVFLTPYLLYSGTSGPNDTGLTLIYYMYLKGFQDMKMGYACASGFVLFIIILIITLMQMGLSRKVHYEG